jgi:hypothetical protein
MNKIPQLARGVALAISLVAFTLSSAAAAAETKSEKEPEKTQAKKPDVLRAGAVSIPFRCDDDMVIAGGIGPGKCVGQEGRLGASATVVELGGNRLAIVACDILMMRRDYFDAALERIEKELGIPAANVLINATHTHHAPSTVTIHGYQRIESFCKHVTDAVVEAVSKANARVTEESNVDFLFSLGHESSVGENSRILLADGTVHWIGPRDDAVRPTGPFDPQLPVLAFKRQSGGYESVLFNHSTHAIGTIKPGVRSPTFYGLAAQRLEKEIGGTVTFVSGAFGSTHNLRLDASEMTHRIETAVRAALRQAQPRPVKRIDGIRREFAYRVRFFDEKREDEAVASYCRKRMGGDPSYCIDVFRRMRKQLAEHQGEERKTWLQAIRIGDVAIVGAPGELFTQLGLDIKRRSPFRYTYIAGAANDYIGYIPDATAYELGGYQVWTGFQSHVAKGTGENIVDATIEMLEELKRR